MSTVKKVIEVMASSDKSFEDALQRLLAETSTTIKGIKSIYVQDQSCKVQDNKIVEYRVTVKLSVDVLPGEHEAAPAGSSSAATSEVELAGNGAPDYSHIEVKTTPELPREVDPGGSATTPESGGGYSG